MASLCQMGSLPRHNKNHASSGMAIGTPSATMRSSASTLTLPSIRTPPVHYREAPSDAGSTVALPRRVSFSQPNDGTSTTTPSKPSRWIQHYKAQAKSNFIDQDVHAMLRKFEDLSVPPRKPLNSSLLAKHATSSTFAGLADDDQGFERTGTTGIIAEDGKGEHFRAGDGVVSIPGLGAARLRRQATKLLVQRRTQLLTTAEQFKRQQLGAKVVPKRFLFDATRWPRSCRCDYCQLAGGDLECATCNVVAHARCYLSAYEASTRKTKGAFVVPTRFSWLCQHCQISLQNEYDATSKKARSDFIANQKTVFGKVVKAYVRMTRDAHSFKKKKDAIIQIQAIMRGQLARMRFNKLQRMRLKPYVIEGLRVHGLKRLDMTSGSDGDELRLANGFMCNPYLYVTVVDGEDDESQVFCYETAIKRGLTMADSDVQWKQDRLFVPGVNGNVTFCFTLLSKNGPNNFMLGQSVLRLRDSDSLWRVGGTVELPVVQDLEIFPRTAQRQALRLADATPPAASQRGTLTDPVFTNGCSAALTLNVVVRPFSEGHSHCGYMLTKNTLESFQTSQRWCVLADGVLRIYRHYGVTLATETVTMAHTIELKLVKTKTVHRHDQWIAMEHITRQFIFQSERSKAATKQWLKKLQAATRYDASSSSGSALVGEKG